MVVNQVRTRNELLYIVKGDIGIEIGSHVGRYSQIILDRTSLKKLYCIDTWDDWRVEDCGTGLERYYKCLRALRKRFKGRYKMIRRTSERAVEFFKLFCADFIFIDAFHSYEEVYGDLCRWWPIVKYGGIFAGHDYGHTWKYGVVQAVNQFFEEQEHPFNVTTHYVGKTWWTVK